MAQALTVARSEAEVERACAVQEMEDWRWFATRIAEAHQAAVAWEDLFRERRRRGAE